LRNLLAADYLPQRESLTPDGAPHDARTEALRICAGLSQGNTIEAEAFAVNLAMEDDARTYIPTIPQMERVVRDTASLYCPQYNN
jgi:hypothetical protein